MAREKQEQNIFNIYYNGRLAYVVDSEWMYIIPGKNLEFCINIIWGRMFIYNFILLKKEKEIFLNQIIYNENITIKPNLHIMP